MSLDNLHITGTLQKMLQTSPSTFHRYAQEAFASPLFADMESLIDADDDAHIISVNSNRMEYAIKRMVNRGVIDLKPFFKRSSSRREMEKGGGWFVIVPIQPTTREMIKSLGRKTYDNIRSAFQAEGDMSSTLSIDGLFDVQNARMNTLDALHYTPKSNNVTQAGARQKSGKIVNTYTFFRTVSSNSAPSSWLLNRNNLNNENTSKRLQDDINALIHKRMKSYTERLG